MAPYTPRKSPSGSETLAPRFSRLLHDDPIRASSRTQSKVENAGQPVPLRSLNSSSSVSSWFVRETSKGGMSGDDRRGRARERRALSALSALSAVFALAMLSPTASDLVLRSQGSAGLRWSPERPMAWHAFAAPPLAGARGAAGLRPAVTPAGDMRAENTPRMACGSTPRAAIIPAQRQSSPLNPSLLWWGARPRDALGRAHTARLRPLPCHGRHVMQAEGAAGRPPRDVSLAVHPQTAGEEVATDGDTFLAVGPVSSGWGPLVGVEEEELLPESPGLVRGALANGLRFSILRNKVARTRRISLASLACPALPREPERPPH